VRFLVTRGPESGGAVALSPGVLLARLQKLPHCGGALLALIRSKTRRQPAAAQTLWPRGNRNNHAQYRQEWAWAPPG